MVKWLLACACFFPTVLAASPVYIRLYECADMLFEGPKEFVLDRGYLIKTRLLYDLEEEEEFAVSELISSEISALVIKSARERYGRYQVQMDIQPNGLSNVTAWVSDRTRDGVCAIELEAWKNGKKVHEFMQVLAIYPGGTLALGLPNSENREGWILLVNREVTVYFVESETSIFDVQAGS